MRALLAGLAALALAAPAAAGPLPSPASEPSVGPSLVEPAGVRIHVSFGRPWRSYGYSHGYRPYSHYVPRYYYGGHYGFYGRPSYYYAPRYYHPAPRYYGYRTFRHW